MPQCIEEASEKVAAASEIEGVGRAISNGRGGRVLSADQRRVFFWSGERIPRGVYGAVNYASGAADDDIATDGGKLPSRAAAKSQEAASRSSRPEDHEPQVTSRRSREFTAATKVLNGQNVAPKQRLLANIRFAASCLFLLFTHCASWLGL